MRTNTWRVALAVSSGLLLWAGPARSEETMELKVELPKAQFQGTPVPVPLENLEKPNTVAPPLRIPAEAAKNVARDKAVTASTLIPLFGEWAMATDGDKEGIDGSFIEIAPGVQWVQVDLGAPFEIYAVALWHFHKVAAAYHDVIVQLADDEDFLTNVRTIYNNDIDNSAGQGLGKDLSYIETNQGRIIDAKGQKARYVRMYSNGSTSGGLNHFTEVEVYARPAK